MAAVTICTDFGAQENKICYCFHFFPTYLHEVMGPDAMILVFWMLSFKPAFSLSSFTFLKWLLSSSLLSALEWYHLHIWGCWYFSQQSWFKLVIHPALHLYSAYKLNKQGDNIQPWHTSFQFWTSLLFHVWHMLIFDLHTGLSRGR